MENFPDFRVKSIVTNENVEQYIEMDHFGVMYEKYCINWIREEFSLCQFLNTIISIHDYAISKRKLSKLFIKELFDEYEKDFSTSTAAYIFGAVYYYMCFTTPERKDILDFIEKNCDKAEYYGPEYEPDETWFENWKNQVEVELIFPDWYSSSVTSQTVENTPDSQPAPHDVFFGFTDKVTEAHLAELKEKCTQNEGAAKAVVLWLKEYSEKEVVDIHGWTKKHLFEALQALGLSCKINNFYKAFTAKEEYMLKKKAVVL